MTPPSTINMKKLHILILEDREEDLLLLLHTLNQSGLEFEHQHVAEEVEFLEALKETTPDVILSDYGLHRYNGLAALKDKKELGAGCPFILVTGSLPDDIAVECLKAGADDYILKDRMNRLPDAIRQAIDRKRSEEDRRKAFSELIRSQKRLEAAERMAKVGNWEWHLASGGITWSDEMYRIMDVPQDVTPTVNSFAEHVHPEDQKKLGKVTKQVTTGGAVEADVTFRIVTKAGECKTIRSMYSRNSVPLTSPDAKIFGTMQDVTVLTQTEQELRQLTEQLEQKVEERTNELSRANDRLRDKNEEMTDSINYARLIQKALLAKLDECRKLFPSSFVLWKPRDIVSGDFYWQYHDGRYAYIAAVDCTGHGVPGAFMSMIGHQMLNQVVIDQEMTNPERILTELDKHVDEALKHGNGQSVRDGMDMILCRIDREEQQICFAGAYRPLFLVRNAELIEYPGDRFPIGNSILGTARVAFNQKCIGYRPGDTIYLTSDGYYSQFGGKNGKKMMKSKFKKLLAGIGALPIDEQYRRLLSHLEEWQGNEPQVDDILVIGIQF